MADQQDPVGHTANTSDTSSDQATADNNARTHEQGAPTEGEELWDSVLYDDDEYKAKVNDTESQVVGTFQKAVSQVDREPGALTQGKTGVNTERKSGFNTWKGVEDDDSIEKQLKNTTAQVVGTFKGLSTAFQQAGETVSKWGQSKDSSEN